ncbi:MAG: class D sortase [Dehalococcoidia bacterium]|nr:class D sortase [Dehalococcoidia bacterium]
MKTRWLSTALMVVGALLLLTSGGYFGLVAYARHDAANFPNEELPRDQRPSAHPEIGLLLDLARLDDGTAVTPRASPPPDTIVIPIIGVESPVVPAGIVVNKDGELEWETPKHAVGHHAGTATPGVLGNVVLSGHISSPIRREGNVFNRLPEVRLGAEVVLTTSEGVYTYQVVSRRVVEPTEISVLDPTDTHILTLLTCYPDLIYTHRLVLRAEPVSFTRHAG